MGTEVLRPQDCLLERIRDPPATISRRRNYGSYCNYYNNYYPPSSRSSRKPANRPERPDQGRRAAVPSHPIPVMSVSKRPSSDDLRMARSSGTTREKVTILRRGASLDSKIMSEALRNNEGDNLMDYPDQPVYAGSACAVSPSPSALPLPSFSKKKQARAVVDDCATRDLRRLLRLE